MHKTMLIILAAVVALIVIVVLTGMRYLRADDEDDFDDENGAQRGQSRGRGEHPARDHLRPRHHDDDRRGDQPRQRPREAAVRGAGRGGADRDRSERAVFAGVGAARRGSGRNDSSGATFDRDAGGAGMSRSGAGRDSGARSGARRGPNRDGAVRDGGIRDSGQRDAPGRDIATRRGERGWDDTGRDDRRNSGPQRRVTGAREYDRDAADDLITASTTSSRGSAGRGGVRAEDLDDRTARPSGRDAGREYPRGQEGGRSSGSREALSRDSADTGRDDRVRDDRERRGNSGQNARPDSRRTATTQGRNDDSLPDVKPRPAKTSQGKTSQGKTSPSKTSPGKSKRDGDGDWPSTEWDELSDVDYWAELASDKPFTGAGPTKPAGRSDRDRADKRSETDSGQIRAVDRRDSPDRRESLERRDRDMKERRDAADRRDAAERRDQMLPAARATVDAAFMPPVTGDAVDHAFTARTDAYGSTELRRAIASGRTSTTGPHRTPQPADDDPLTSPSFPRISADDSRSYRRANGRGPGESESQTRPHAAYPPLPPHPPVGPLDSQPGLSRTSGGYSQPAASGSEYAAAPLPDQYRQPASAQESRPAHPLTSSYSTPAPAALPASYLPPVGNGYPADSASSTYSAPTSATSGYPAIPAVGYQGADPTSYQAPMSVPNLPGPNLPGLNSPGPNSPGPNPASFAAEHDNGYGAVAPAGTGYPGAPAAASYPPPPVELPGYSSYPGVGQIPAAQPQSTGFSYSQPADPGFGGQLPAAQQSGSYLGYQPPAHTGQAGVYQMPAPSMPPPAVQPGYPSAPYSAAPYEPPAYPAPTRAYEADGGYPADPYPADPYAVDPYGYPGYGSARLSDQRWHGLPLSDQRWDERSRQEQSTDDRSGTARYEYQQYWEDDDR